MAIVDVDRVGFASREYRTLTREDLNVQTKHPLSVELEFTSYVSSSTDAQTLGDQILNLRKVERDTWAVTVNRQNYSVELGDTVRVVYPRFGLSGGKNFIVKRLKRDSNSLFDELTLFGPE